MAHWLYSSAVPNWNVCTCCLTLLSSSKVWQAQKLAIILIFRKHTRFDAQFASFCKLHGNVLDGNVLDVNVLDVNVYVKCCEFPFPRQVNIWLANHEWTSSVTLKGYPPMVYEEWWGNNLFCYNYSLDGRKWHFLVMKIIP